MNSYIYKGKVIHKRFSPIPHFFSYKLFMMCIDLSELDKIFSNSLLWSTKGKAVVEFRRSDYLFDHTVDIETEIKKIVNNSIGFTPNGKIYMITNLRYFGFNFNPVSFYLCYNKDEKLDAIVAEITNTPWGEKHCYVLDSNGLNIENGIYDFNLSKDFHISPFMAMDYKYQWKFTIINEMLNINMRNLKDNEKHFEANMNMKKQQLTKKTLAINLFKFPLLTVKILLAIYWQALKLKLKGVPFYGHPKYDLETKKEEVYEY